MRKCMQFSNRFGNANETKQTERKRKKKMKKKKKKTTVTTTTTGDRDGEIYYIIYNFQIVSFYQTQQENGIMPWDLLTAFDIIQSRKNNVHCRNKLYKSISISIYIYLKMKQRIIFYFKRNDGNNNENHWNYFA